MPTMLVTAGIRGENPSKTYSKIIKSDSNLSKRNTEHPKGDFTLALILLI